MFKKNLTPNQTKHLLFQQANHYFQASYFSLLILNDLSTKEGNLFCFVLFSSYEIHQTGMLEIVLLVSLESSRQGGVHGLWFLQCKSS
jgi:hypothetical protein